MKQKQDKNQAAVALGKMGGAANLARYGKEQLKAWGKLGGRPKKEKDKNVHSQGEIKKTTDLPLRETSSQEGV